MIELNLTLADMCFNTGCVKMSSCVEQCESFLYTKNHYYLWILILNSILIYSLFFMENKYIKKYHNQILLFIFIINLTTLFYEGFW